MRIGDYEVTGELGRGGMGQVLRAKSPRGDDVAIKVLLRPDARESAGRFERERKLLAVLGEDAGFVPLLDLGTSPVGPYLVMAFVGGGTLRARVARGPLAVDEVVRVGRALATSIGNAHAQGIVHRDLKPENVLFTADGRPLIADLGLAKHFGGENVGASRCASLTREGQAAGTFGYMPREQITDARSVGPPADVFALGAILYECLAGAPAYVGETTHELAVKICEGAFEPVARRRADVPGWLAQVVERCLDPDPVRRYANGAALAEALAGQRLEARPRARAVWIALAGLAGLVLVGVALVVALRARLGTAAPVPSVPGAAATPARRALDAALDAVRRRQAPAGPDVQRLLDHAGEAPELPVELVDGLLVLGQGALAHDLVRARRSARPDDAAARGLEAIVALGVAGAPTEPLGAGALGVAADDVTRGLAQARDQGGTLAPRAAWLLVDLALGSGPAGRARLGLALESARRHAHPSAAALERMAKLPEDGASFATLVAEAEHDTLVAAALARFLARCGAPSGLERHDLLHAGSPSPEAAVARETPRTFLARPPRDAIPRAKKLRDDAASLLDVVRYEVRTDPASPNAGRESARLWLGESLRLAPLDDATLYSAGDPVFGRLTGAAFLLLGSRYSGRQCERMAVGASSLDRLASRMFAEGVKYLYDERWETHDPDPLAAVRTFEERLATDLAEDPLVKDALAGGLPPQDLAQAQRVAGGLRRLDELSTREGLAPAVRGQLALEALVRLDEGVRLFGPTILPHRARLRRLVFSGALGETLAALDLERVARMVEHLEDRDADLKMLCFQSAAAALAPPRSALLEPLGRHLYRLGVDRLHEDLVDSAASSRLDRAAAKERIDRRLREVRGHITSYQHLQALVAVVDAKTLEQDFVSSAEDLRRTQAYRFSLPKLPRRR